MNTRDIDPALLDAPDRICAALLRTSPDLSPDSIMLVGAHCRDILHAGQGHSARLVTTDDIDFGVTLADWAAFERLTADLERAGDTGIRFIVEGIPIDLMPFGDVEQPTGTVTPRPRDEALSVWAFREVFEHSDALTLPSAGTIRIPTVPGT